MITFHSLEVMNPHSLQKRLTAQTFLALLKKIRSYHHRPFIHMTKKEDDHVSQIF